VVLRVTRAIWTREMRKWRRNKVQLLSSLLLPILLLVVIGNAYSGSVNNVPVVVINQDNGLPAQVFDEALHNSTSLSIISTNVTIQEARTMIDDGKIAGFILIPANFSESLLPLPWGVLSSESNKINITVDNSNQMVAQALSGITAESLNVTVHDERVSTWFTNITSIPYQVGGSYIDTIDRYSTGFTFIDFLAPGILAMTVLFTSLFAAGMPVILDREIGYFDMLLTTPTRRSEIVLGFTTAGVTKVVAQATFVLIIAFFLGIHMAMNVLSIVYIYVLTILLALVFVGISIAMSVKVELTAFQFVNGLINFPVFFLSGAFYPIESLPLWLKDIVYLNPLTYAVNGLRAVMIKGTSLFLVLPDVFVVAIFALLTQILGNVAFYLALSGKKIRLFHRKERDTPLLEWEYER
jgi:ABC-2 type transport system permease protein